jgi:hypothetical protein
MNYKTIQRVHSLYEDLKALDTEINQIDKLAIYVAHNKATVNLAIRADKDKTDQVNPVLDSDGSLLGIEKRMYQNFFEAHTRQYAFLTGSTSQPKSDFELNYVLSESTCLGVLDVLIRDKNERRKTITDELRGIFNL